jgi:hypothetical protein
LALCPTSSVGRIGRGCRRTALPPASISGSTSPTTSIKGRSQASAFRGPRDLHFKIPTDADAASAAYALKGREARHPHNIYLQTGFELGAIGAVLLLGVGLAALLIGA